MMKIQQILYQIHNFMVYQNNIIIQNNSVTFSFQSSEQPNRGNNKQRWGIRCITKGINLKILP